MGKNIFKLSLLFILLGLPLASCSDDDEKQPEPEAVTATVKYSIPDRHDLLTYMDMTVHYTNSEGKEVSEKVSKASWEKSITKVSVPGTYSLKVTYIRNSTPLPLTKESYTFGTGLKISYSTSDGRFEESGLTGTAIVKKENVEKYLTEMTKTKDETSIEIPK